MATATARRRGRSAGQQWESHSGAITMNGTTAVEDTIILNHPASEGFIRAILTSGTNGNRIEISLYDDTFFNTGEGDLVNIEMPPVGNPATTRCGIVVAIGQNVSGDGSPGIAPDDLSLYKFRAVADAAETGTLTYEIWLRIGS